MLLTHEPIHYYRISSKEDNEQTEKVYGEWEPKVLLSSKPLITFYIDSFVQTLY